MRVLFTGAARFIGSALGNRLSREPHLLLRAAVRTARGPSSQGVDTVAVGNIDGATDWREALKGVDVVGHLAARVHVMNEAARDALAAFRATNRDGTLRLAEAMVREGCRRLVFVSTAKVMGEATLLGVPFTSDSRAAPAHPYACSKWEAEQGLQTLQQSGALECVVIRPPLVYGPGVGANFLAMMRWLDRRWPLPLGSVRNRRTLVAAPNLTDLIAVCVYGKLNWRAGDWQWYQGQDVEVIMAFDKPRAIKKIAANFLEDQNSWIFYPKEVSFYVSNDSTQWTLIENIATNKSDHAEKTSISMFETSIRNIKKDHYRYAQVIAKNFGPMPQWHEGRGNPTFVFLDEFIVE